MHGHALADAVEPEPAAVLAGRGADRTVVEHLDLDRGTLPRLAEVAQGHPRRRRRGVASHVAERLLRDAVERQPDRVGDGERLADAVHLDGRAIGGHGELSDVVEARLRTTAGGRGLVVGAEQPDEGTLRLGETVELAYVDQSRDVLDGEKTVWQEISEGRDEINLGTRSVNSRAYVGRFNFGGGDQQKLVVGSSYSGNVELTQGVDRMNQHDYASARAHFDAVTDPLARAWGHAWWLGWLSWGGY